MAVCQAPGYGRSLKGEPAHLWQVFSWDNHLRSVYAAITPKGILLKCSRALLGGIDDDSFYEWFLTYLYPNLNPYDNRLLLCSALIFDNWIGHWQPRVLAKLMEKGVQLLPLAPYDPFSAPLDNTAFAMMKSYIKANGDSPLYQRNPDMAIDHAFRSITPEMAAGCFRKSGYGPRRAEMEQHGQREQLKRKRRRQTFLLLDELDSD